MNNKITYSDVTAEVHLNRLKENLAHCWVAAQLLARLQNLKKYNEYKMLTSRVIADALTDNIIMTMARLWDMGPPNKDCLSIPNLKGRTNLKGRNGLKLTEEQESRLDCLRTEEIVKTASALRHSFVAHSLATPKKGANKEMRGDDIQSFIERCHSLLSDVQSSNFGCALGWGNFDEELEKWETLIREVEFR